MGKLVRDKIPEIIRKNGKVAFTHKASEKEYSEMLNKKLKEETNEFIADENKEELADILEVIDAICHLKNIDKKELEKIKLKKRRERGGFMEGIILDGTG